MHDRGDPIAHDIYTEPEDFDLDTLRNLGPLAPLAGVWEGQGVDTHPVAEGTEDEPYRERMVFEPIDPQPNGPQLLYGLRYHVHVNKLDERLTFHDQQDTVLQIAARAAPFHHVDRNLLRRVAAARPNPVLVAGAPAPR